MSNYITHNSSKQLYWVTVEDPPTLEEYDHEYEPYIPIDIYREIPVIDI